MLASISFCRAMRASHHLACGSLALRTGAASAVRAEFPIPPTSCRSAALSAARSGSSTACHFSQMSSISGLLAMRFERDVRHALIDKALANIVMDRRIGGNALRELGFLGAAFLAVGEQIPGIARRHDPRAGKRQRNAAGIDGDPAPPPLLGDIGGRAGAAGGIEHKVAGIGGHQNAAFERPLVQFELHRFCRRQSCRAAYPSRCCRIGLTAKIVNESDDSEAFSRLADTRSAFASRPCHFASVFQCPLPGSIRLPSKIEVEDRLCERPSEKSCRRSRMHRTLWQFTTSIGAFVCRHAAVEHPES